MWKNLLLLSHHLIKKNNLINLDKLHRWELCNILVYTFLHKPTSQVYFENIFRKQQLNWKEIYMLYRKESLDCIVRSFQYKVLYKILLIFGKSSFSLCSFCRQADEMILPLFYGCIITKELWNRPDLFFNDCFNLPQLLQHTAFFVFFNTYSNDFIFFQNISYSFTF